MKNQRKQISKVSYYEPSKNKIPRKITPMPEGSSTNMKDNLLASTYMNECAYKSYIKIRISDRSITHSGGYQWHIDRI